MSDSPREPSPVSKPVMAPELLDEVAALLGEIAVDRVHPDIRPPAVGLDPDWLRAAVAEQYGLLGRALREHP